MDDDEKPPAVIFSVEGTASPGDVAINTPEGFWEWQPSLPGPELYFSDDNPRAGYTLDSVRLLRWAGERGYGFPYRLKGVLPTTGGTAVPTDEELERAKRFNARQIGLIYGIPPWWFSKEHDTRKERLRWRWGLIRRWLRRWTI